MISLLIFFGCYVGFLLFTEYKAWIALGGALALIFLGVFTPGSAFNEIHWNVMGLFIGMLLIAELFIYSRVPAVLAERLVVRSKSLRGALLAIFMLTSIISMFVENVAVVLIMAPVAFALCEKVNISAVKALILLAMFSNLQGTATLIGDPPSMIVGSYLHLTFSDFFVYQEKLSLFFFVQTGAFFTLVLAYWLFRHEERKIELIPVEKVLSWLPTTLLCLLIAILAIGSSFDPKSEWLAGAVAMLFGCIGLIWHHFGPKWQSTITLIKTLDWQTSIFLAALFILVGGIREEGWMEALATWIVKTVPSHQFGFFIFIIGVSLIISAFVDNIPFLLAMIPVIQEVAEVKGFPLPLLIFALLIGTCLGGNITPIGASANIVAVSFLQKKGYSVTYPYYMRLGIAFTAFAVIPAAVALWAIWA